MKQIGVIISILTMVSFACNPEAEVKQESNSKAYSDHNLPTPGRHSPGHIEIPSKNHIPPRAVNMLTLIVTNNYVQHHTGEMELFNYHRYGEIFVLPRENLQSANFTRVGGPVDEFTSYLDYRSFFFEGGYFPSLAAMRAQYPGEDYKFEMIYADGTEHSHVVKLPDASSPPATTMSVFQEGQEKSPLEIDPNKELVVRWTDFSDGTPDSSGISKNLVTIIVNPCDEEGSKLYISGVPTLNEHHLTYQDKEATIPAGTLKPGMWHWLNGEFSNTVSASTFDGAPALSSYMTSTYLAIRTMGGPEESTCAVSLSKLTE